MHRKYSIRYLDVAISDLQDIIDYITFELKAYQAANNLLIKFEESISNLRDFPFSGVEYKRDKNLEFDYRMIFIDNFTVFYVVFEKEVEIHRVLYSRRKYDDLL